MTRSQPSAHRPSRRRPWAPLRARIGWPRPWRRTPSTADTAANAAPTAAARPPTGTGTARAAPTPSARPDSQPQRGQQPHRDQKPRQGPGLRALLGYFLLVLAVAVIYVRYQGLPVVQSLFYGIAPGVMAIIALAAVKLARLTNQRDPRLWAITALIGAVTAITDRKS